MHRPLQYKEIKEIHIMVYLISKDVVYKDDFLKPSNERN